MKRIGQILLVSVVTASFCWNAGGETMAERKQRIMRKYMREQQPLVQSDMVVPAATEDARVVGSEKYRDMDVDLSRNKQSAAPPVPAARPIPAQVQKNLTATESSKDFDPEADPFALDSQEDTTKDSKSSWLDDWRKRRSEMEAQRAANASGTYDSTSGRGSSSGQPSSYGYAGQQDRTQGYTSYGSTPQSGYSRSTSSGRVGPYGSWSYGSSPSGMLKLPSSTRGTDDSSRSVPSSSYTPYRSPYATQQEDRRQQKTQQSQQEDFVRPAPYQQWKDSNKSWDPTADDAYLDELMRRNRD